MLLPDEATSAFGRTDYGYHLQAMAYASHLKSTAATLGVKMYQTQTGMVERDENGLIAALIVDGSLRIEGHLFVDASAEGAILIGRPLEVRRPKWRPYSSSVR